MSDYAMTPAERKKVFRGFKVGDWQRSHPAKPGTGPAGETCKTCAHIHRNQMAKTYLKCELMRAKWTGGYGTDIKASDAACEKWEKGE